MNLPPTSFQISNINGGTGAFNIIPGTLEVYFNFRFATASTEASLRERTEAILDRHGLDVDITWTLGGKPFLTPRGKLVDALSAAVHTVTGITPELSTASSTCPTGVHRRHLRTGRRFGPINATIHKIDEHVAIADISRLHEIFRALQKICCSTIPTPWDTRPIPLRRWARRWEPAEQRFLDAGLFFGHGSANAYNEAAYLVLHTLALPLDDLDSDCALTASEQQAVAAIIARRIHERVPAAYLTHEAWAGPYSLLRR